MKTTKMMALPVDLFVSYDTTNFSEKEIVEMEKQFKKSIKGLINAHIDYAFYYDKDGVEYHTKRIKAKIGDFEEVYP